MSYRAPVRDIRFSLEEIASLDSVRATGAFPEFSGDLTGAILEEAAKLCNDVIAPLNWPSDQQGCTLKDGEVKTPRRLPPRPMPNSSKAAGRACNLAPSMAAWAFHVRWAARLWKCCRAPP